MKGRRIPKRRREAVQAQETRESNALGGRDARRWCLEDGDLKTICRKGAFRTSRRMVFPIAKREDHAAGPTKTAFGNTHCVEMLLCKALVAWYQRPTARPCAPFPPLHHHHLPLVRLPSFHLPRQCIPFEVRYMHESMTIFIWTT